MNITFLKAFRHYQSFAFVRWLRYKREWSQISRSGSRMRALALTFHEAFRQQNSHALEHRLFQAALAGSLLVPWMLVLSRSLAEVCAQLSVLCFLVTCYRARRWGWVSDPVCRVGFMAWGWMLLIVSPLADNPLESLGVALAWIRWILLYAALRHWVWATPAALRMQAANIVLLLALVIVDTLWQYVFGVSLSGNYPNESYRLTGPMDNLKVGIFIAKLSFPVAVIWLVHGMITRNSLHKISAGAFYLLSFMTVMLSGERTATFSSLLAMITVVVLLAWMDRANRRFYLLSIAGLLCLFFAVLFTQPILQDRLQTLAHILREFPSSAYGQLFWVGYDIGFSHWFSGAGLKGFRTLCLPYLESGQVTHCNLHPHNPYIEWFAEMGLPGLLWFCALIAALAANLSPALKANNKHLKIIALCAAGLLVMHFFPLMATQSIFSNWPTLLLWFSLALGMSAPAMVQSTDINR